MPSLPSLLRRLPPAAQRLIAALLFLAAWALLDAAVNLRYPSLDPGPSCWYLLPAIDVCVLLGLFAVVGWSGRRVPRGAMIALAVLLLFVRLFRIADGTIEKQWFRTVNLYLDVPLLPDLARLLRSTVSPGALVLGGIAVLVAIAGFVALMYLCLRGAERFLAGGRWQRGLFAAVVLACAALSLLRPVSNKLRRGWFGRSIAPTFVEQVRFAASAKQRRRLKLEQVRAMQQTLQATPTDLRALGGADLLLFLIESYGSSVFHDPALRRQVGPALARFEADLTKRGYLTASKMVISSTYGGGSWWAHATLATGVRIGDGLEYGLLLQMVPPPTTLASIFTKAGYRTVLVQPGTTRPFPEGLVAGFAQKYYAWHFDYAGPAFGWSLMPDQYVVDFLDRHEVQQVHTPLFVQYTLVSSHAPWSTVPTLVDDWPSIGRGEVFREHELRFPVSWRNLSEGGPAYGSSIVYDVDVLRRYIVERLDRNALIVILGDHQPAGSIIHNDPSWAVPLHVATRNRELMARFVSAGYKLGMTPAETARPAGLETLLPELVAAMSRR
jgi:hypothetical protein